jgi:hypothetical protein
VFSDFPVRDSASFATFTDQAIFEQPIERVIEFRQRVREEFDRLVEEIRVEPVSSQAGKEIARYAEAHKPILSAQAAEFRWAQPVKPNCL